MSSLNTCPCTPVPGKPPRWCEHCSKRPAADVADRKRGAAFARLDQAAKAAVKTAEGR